LRESLCSAEKRNKALTKTVCGKSLSDEGIKKRSHLKRLLVSYQHNKGIKGIWPVTTLTA